MYVNPFWFGVLTTLVVEVVLLLGFCFYLAGKGHRR